jgi:protein-S-isoprenylcysteine O-methyltransferase Ste14
MVGRTPGDIATQLLGLAVLGVGAVLFAASLRRFVSEGDGTLAPWDPPRRLVVRGPYRYVRNPMISGVIFVLCGEALILLSRWHGQWAAAVLIINVIYIPLLEEPVMMARFGDDYREYCRHVRRILPRLRPWQPVRFPTM